MMLVFVIPSCYPNAISINSGIFVKEQCLSLKKEGYKVIVLDATSIGWRYWQDKYLFKTSESSKEGLIVYSKHYRGIALSKLPRFSFNNYFRNIHQLYKEAVKNYGKPDLMHAHFTFTSGYAAMLLSKKYNVPFVVTEHGSLFLRKSLKPYIKRMLNITIKNANAFITVSQSLSEAIGEHIKFKKKIVVIPNMVDEIFSYNENKECNKFVFFSAGSLIRGKRMDVLIKAFVKAFQSNEKIILEIAGDGSEYKKLESMINECGRKHQIILLGNLDRNEIYKRYVKCSVFILASAYETFGLVYREAMAVGRPIIATKNGGIKEGWQDYLGKLVEVDDVDELAQAMKYMYKNINDYDGRKISLYTRNIYSSKSIINRIKSIYEEVLK